MRKRILSLTIPLVVVAACASTAGSPSAAAPSAAAPSAAVSSPSPSASASAAPSVAPSEAPASLDPATAFRDDTLQPVLDEINTSLTRWADAATAAAAPDADDLDRISLSNAAFRARVALASGTALLEAAEVPECATDVRDQALTFIEALTQSSEDLLADDAVSPDDVATVVQQAADGTPALTEGIAQACASG